MGIAFRGRRLKGAAVLQHRTEREGQGGSEGKDVGRHINQNTAMIRRRQATMKDRARSHRSWSTQ